MICFEDFITLLLTTNLHIIQEVSLCAEWPVSSSCFLTFPPTPFILTFDKGHLNYILWKAIQRNTTLLSFTNPALIVHEYMPLLQETQDFLPVHVTLNIGHLNWHAMKGFAIYCHCASFHDCIGDSDQEYAAALWRFSISPFHCDFRWRSLKLTWPERPCHKVPLCQISWPQWPQHPRNGNVRVFSRFFISYCLSDLRRRSLKLVWPERPFHKVPLVPSFKIVLVIAFDKTSMFNFWGDRQTEWRRRAII